MIPHNEDISGKSFFGMSEVLLGGQVKWLSLKYKYWRFGLVIIEFGIVPVRRLWLRNLFYFLFIYLFESIKKEIYNNCNGVKRFNSCGISPVNLLWSRFLKKKKNWRWRSLCFFKKKGQKITIQLIEISLQVVLGWLHLTRCSWELYRKSQSSVNKIS